MHCTASKAIAQGERYCSVTPASATPAAMIQYGVRGSLFTAR
jgi:hypothetical protein